MKSLSDNFFNELAQSVEKDNRAKRLRIIVRLFVRFRYDNHGRHFEMIRPMSKIDASIRDVDDVRKTGIIFDDGFPVAPSQSIWSGRRGVSTIANR